MLCYNELSCLFSRLVHTSTLSWSVLSTTNSASHGLSQTQRQTVSEADTVSPPNPPDELSLHLEHLGVVDAALLLQPGLQVDDLGVLLLLQPPEERSRRQRPLSTPSGL